MSSGNVDLMDRLRRFPGLERVPREELVKAVYLKDKRALPDDLKRLLDSITVLRIPVEDAEDISHILGVATGEVAGISLGLPADSLHYVRTRLAMMKDRELAVDWTPREDPFDGEILPQLDGFQVDLAKLKRVELDEENGVVLCGVGARWREVFETCESMGWIFPLSPILPSNPYLGDVVGGTAFLASFKGGPEAYVRNIDFLSPDGRYGESGFDLVPNNAAGYDLNSLMLVMGRHMIIPVSVTFTLLPMASTVKTSRYSVWSPEALVEAMRNLINTRVQPLRVSFGDGTGSLLAFGREGEPTIEIVLAGTEETLPVQQKLVDAAFKEGANKEEVEGLTHVTQSAPGGDAPPSLLVEFRASLADLQLILQDVTSWVEAQGSGFGIIGSLYQAGTVSVIPFISGQTNRGERFTRVLELAQIARKHSCRLRNNPTIHLLSPEANLGKRFALVRRMKERVDLPHVINPSSLLMVPRDL
ncbi:MAG: FAD-binding oxidoreductase [Thermoplasmata archaeon]